MGISGVPLFSQAYSEFLETVHESMSSVYLAYTFDTPFLVFGLSIL